MPVNPSATNHVESPAGAKEESPASQRPSQQRTAKLALLLLSIVFCVAAFLIFDWFRSAAIVRHFRSTFRGNPCRVHDPVRHHALKPNCVATDQWGGDNYDFITNNLGFRDEKVRDVPLADARTRILMLGDSFTEAPLAWRDSFAGRIAADLPQYDFLNGGVGSYSPSNYLNVARMVLARGVEIDEVIVFIDISDVHDEAAFYRDVDASGAVTGPEQERWVTVGANKWRAFITGRLLLTDYLLRSFERFLVGRGHYYLPTGPQGEVFDRERSAWTYRKVNEKDPYYNGFGPLGVKGGIAKEESKMTLLWQELQARNIPISVVVYPYPAQLVHDSVESVQVRMWRDWCEGKCKRFISLFPAFFAVKDQCPKSRPGCWYLTHFIFGDFHYNAAGNAVVADVVVKSLTDDPPAKRPETPAKTSIQMPSPTP